MLGGDEVFNLKAIRLLLKSGCDVNGHKDHDRSPLMIAVIWCRAKVVHTLLGHGADRDWMSRDGYKAIDFITPRAIVDGIDNKENPMLSNSDVSGCSKQDIKQEEDRRKVYLMLQYYKLPPTFIQKHSGRPMYSPDEIYIFTSKTFEGQTDVTIEPLDIVVSYAAKFNSPSRPKAVGMLRRGEYYIPKIAISGWKINKESEPFLIDAYYWTDKVLSLCERIGHKLPLQYADHGKPGRYNACHAEKQLMAYLIEKHVFLRHEIEEGQPLAELYRKRPGFGLCTAIIQTSIDICDDCLEFFWRIEEYCSIKIIIDLNCSRRKIEIDLS